MSNTQSSAFSPEYEKGVSTTSAPSAATELLPADQQTEGQKKTSAGPYGVAKPVRKTISAKIDK
jgi:hypothetical protein